MAEGDAAGGEPPSRWPCCALLLAAAWSSACSQAAGKPERPPAAVRVEEAALADVPVELSTIGTVVPVATVGVRSRVEGQLEAVLFEEGHEVVAGEPLFRLDRLPFEAALARARATLHSDEVQAQLAQQEAGRYAELFTRSLASRQEYDERVTRAGALRAAVLGDREAVKQAQLELGYTSIVAPLSGRTGALQLDPGNLVKANGDDPLVEIRQVAPIEVSFALPGRRLREIRERQARGALAVRVVAPDGTEASGTLAFIDATVAPSSGTVELKGSFPNERRELWPGQFVDVTLTLSTLRGVVVVPEQAVQAAQSGELCFVVTPALTVEARQVKSSIRHQGLVVLESGVAAGERVVTDGLLGLTPGASVEVKPEPAPARGPGT